MGDYIKNIYFLSGLPRSGNTLLSTLLNQNPKFYSSPLSPMLNCLISVDEILKTNENALMADFENNINFGLKHYVEGFYSNIKEPIIFDRNKMWGSKKSIYIAYKYITDKPKIIYTVRDIPSILSSFITLIQGDEENFLDKKINEAGIKPYGTQTQNDLRCDWLMNYQILNCLVFLTELLQVGIPVCLIEYDDLIANPQEQLNKIYDFLEIEHYAHDFLNIKKIENENLENVGLPKNFHDVRSKIEKISIPAQLILPELSKNKYSGLEFWRQ